MILSRYSAFVNKFVYWKRCRWIRVYFQIWLSDIRNCNKHNMVKWFEIDKKKTMKMWIYWGQNCFSEKYLTALFGLLMSLRCFFVCFVLEWFEILSNFYQFFKKEPKNICNIPKPKLMKKTFTIPRQHYKPHRELFDWNFFVDFKHVRTI